MNGTKKAIYIKKAFFLVPFCPCVLHAHGISKEENRKGLENEFFVFFPPSVPLPPI